MELLFALHNTDVKSVAILTKAGEGGDLLHRVPVIGSFAHTSNGMSAGKVCGSDYKDST